MTYEYFKNFIRSFIIIVLLSFFIIGLGLFSIHCFCHWLSISSYAHSASETLFCEIKIFVGHDSFVRYRRIIGECKAVGGSYHFLQHRIEEGIQSPAGRSRKSTNSIEIIFCNQGPKALNVIILQNLQQTHSHIDGDCMLICDQRALTESPCIVIWTTTEEIWICVERVE